MTITRRARLGNFSHSSRKLFTVLNVWTITQISANKGAVSVWLNGTCMYSNNRLICDDWLKKTGNHILM